LVDAGKSSRVTIFGQIFEFGWLNKFLRSSSACELFAAKSNETGRGLS